MENDVSQAISFLVRRLQKEDNADAALKYSQSALNLIHVMQIYQANDMGKRSI